MSNSFTVDLYDMSLSNSIHLSIHGEWSGSPNGIISLNQKLHKSLNFIHISGSDHIITEAGGFIWEIPNVLSDFLQINYQANGGTGVFKAFSSIRNLVI